MKLNRNQVMVEFLIGRIIFIKLTTDNARD